MINEELIERIWVPMKLRTSIGSTISDENQTIFTRTWTKRLCPDFSKNPGSVNKEGIEVNQPIDVFKLSVGSPEMERFNELKSLIPSYTREKDLLKDV